MKPNEGRLQTGEHIFARIIEDRVPDARVVIAKFDKENEGSVDFSTSTDLRELALEDLEQETNEVIKKELPVHKKTSKREEIENEFDLSKIPESVKEIRIVEIEGFDKRPCRDPHVDNTKEIGRFAITRVERVGKDRYRFLFQIR
ncbi:hypothetical protein KY363_00820 [Candidatus Woesearchaeota archaeon]|nr:hypothetical protein [Candidatus Woesearchaeota archaeon]